MRLQDYLDDHGVGFFKAGELYTREAPPEALWGNIIPTLYVADQMRIEFGPGRVRSGYRDQRHNEEVGGASNSLHLVFNALDLSFATGVPQGWYEFAQTLSIAQLTGLGVYDTFIHIDTRGLVFRRPRASWEG